jgi:GNAT superfamily N-acetyltransferase
MESVTISRHDPPLPEHRAAVLDRLVAFSDPRAGAGDWPEHKLCLAIHGADGALAGGLWGRFYYDWLFVELIFVPEDRRGQDLGSALLAMAEAQARGWGAIGLWLDTFSFQALGFYQRKGFAVFGEIGDYPGPHRRFFLSKRLDPAGPRSVVHPAITTIAAPEPHHREAIGSALSLFNDTRLGGGPWPDDELALVLTDAAGTVLGGLWGRSYYHWLFVDLLFVPESLRGRGLGAALLAQAEEAARAQGCVGVWLDTFSFQAPEFYRRHGYESFGEIGDYPAPHRRHFFSKRL